MKLFLPLTLFGALWLGLILFALNLIAREQLTPGAAGSSPDEFPAAARLLRSPSMPTLVVFLHPYCPCSRATLHELNAVFAQVREPVAQNLIFAIPEKLPGDWKTGGLWQAARHISGARVLEDKGGREARLFGAHTSGDCYLYSAQGRLLYHGGVTGMRGHEGSNRGEDALVSFINTGHADTTSAPVFGCSLL